jgi:ABC-type transport system involved in cytochrome bd biosynthesis fused ATPase/permease subunit
MLEELNFEYPAKKGVSVLKDVNLEIKQGESVAFFG